MTTQDHTIESFCGQALAGNASFGKNVPFWIRTTVWYSIPSPPRIFWSSLLSNLLLPWRLHLAVLFSYHGFQSLNVIAWQLFTPYRDAILFENYILFTICVLLSQSKFQLTTFPPFAPPCSIIHGGPILYRIYGPPNSRRTLMVFGGLLGRWTSSKFGQGRLIILIGTFIAFRIYHGIRLTLRLGLDSWRVSVLLL